MGCIYKRGRIWWIEYWQRGRRFWESSHSPCKSDATSLLRIREGHLAEGRPLTAQALRLRFEDLVEDLRNDYAGRGPHGPRRLKHELAHLEKQFAGWRAQDLTTDAIRAYTARRQEEGAANATINRELAAIRRAFNLAVAAGKLWHRPHVPMLREANPRQGFFEPEMFEKVRAELPDYLYGVITFGYYTGWRKSEIVSLRWQQVDLERGEVRLEPGTTKNREGRTVFLDGELREVLERSWEMRVLNCDYVFHRQAEAVGDFKKAWASACKRAGCVGMLFHDLRRTAVRNMVRAGIHERVAMEISGHKTRAIFDRYHIVSEGDLREAAWKLAAWSGGVAAETIPHPDNSPTVGPLARGAAAGSMSPNNRKRDG